MEQQQVSASGFSHKIRFFSPVDITSLCFIDHILPARCLNRPSALSADDIMGYRFDEVNMKTRNLQLNVYVTY